MTAKLTKEISDALHATGDDRLNLIDPTTNRLYVLIDAATLQSLERQQTEQAIQAGIDSMNAGGGQPLDEAMADLRAKFQPSHR